ncbi:MAG TPA: NAD(P)H-hydrate dehydratase [Hanamia sp.]|nr:NAD(P)H-hydrate dehydratase [Hanamia sp.]
MKIFSVSQIKAWDAYTISHRPVKSIALMERAAAACFKWIVQYFDPNTSFKIFCGKGNNGGDGLAIARLLSTKKYKVSVYIIGRKTSGSPDFETNLKKLKKTSAEIFFLDDEKSFPLLSKEDVIIDALFGTGLNKKPSGLFALLIEKINAGSSKVISIDVPSGLQSDGLRLTEGGSRNLSDGGRQTIKASFTLSFQNQKLAFLLPENESFIGEVVLLDIGLSKEYEEKENAQFEFIDKKLIKNIYTPRKIFANKGNYGYASLLVGSYGMMGAAVLSSLACLRSGVGKLTSYICEAGYNAFQTSVPEAMCKVSGDKFIKEVKDFSDFDVIGVGPGIGKYSSHKKLLKDLFSNYKKPVVIDADALNVLSENKILYKQIPANSIITPHPKEFERLFGKSDSDFGRIHLALSKAKELNIFIIVKGHYTFIATPDEKGFFNSTGNAGMATAGAGDVLTGIVTGLLAQKYSPLNACILGVYLHGLAGDIAAKNISEEALIADDIVDNLGNAFKEIVAN